MKIRQCITSNDFKDINTAIAAYEKQMKTRAAKEQESLEMAEWMHAEGGLAKMVQMLN